MANNYSFIAFGDKRGVFIARLEKEIGSHMGSIFVRLHINPANELNNVRNPYSVNFHEVPNSDDYIMDIKILSLLNEARADDSYKEIKLLPAFFQIEHDICGTISFTSVLRPEGTDIGNAVMIESEGGILPENVHTLIVMMSKVKLTDIYSTLRDHSTSYVMFMDGVEIDRDKCWRSITDLLGKESDGLIDRIIKPRRDDNNPVWISDRYRRRNTGVKKSIRHQRRIRR